MASQPILNNSHNVDVTLQIARDIKAKADAAKADQEMTDRLKASQKAREVTQPQLIVEMANIASIKPEATPECSRVKVREGARHMRSRHPISRVLRSIFVR